MTDSRTANELSEARKAAGAAMDEYFENNYPFSDAAYEEYLRISILFVAATEALEKRCDPAGDNQLSSCVQRI